MDNGGNVDDFVSFDESDDTRKGKGKINMLEDIYLPVSIELGRTRLEIRDIFDLEKGSIIEFDKLAGETVDLLVNDKKFAEGEVVVIDEHFGIRITNLVKLEDIVKDMAKFG